MKSTPIESNSIGLTFDTPINVAFTEFPVEIFFLVFTQFLTKAGRVCDEELFFVFTQIKNLLFFPLFPALVLAKELNISFRILIKFLSEDLVTCQGLIKSSFEAI